LIKRALADIEFIFTCYNLRRLLNIIGTEAFGRYLSYFLVPLTPLFASIDLLYRIQDYHTKISILKTPIIKSNIFANLAEYYYRTFDSKQRLLDGQPLLASLTEQIDIQVNNSKIFKLHRDYEIKNVKAIFVENG